MCSACVRLSRPDLTMVSLQRRIPLQLKAGAKFWFLSALTRVGTKCACWWTTMREGRRGCQGRQGWSTAAAHLNIHPGTARAWEKREERRNHWAPAAATTHMAITDMNKRNMVHFGLFSSAGYGQLVCIWAWGLSWFKDRHWLHFLCRQTWARSQKQSFSTETG